MAAKPTASRKQTAPSPCRSTSSTSTWIDGQGMSGLDSNVHVVREGNGDALILLHCLGVDHHFWDFAAPLCADFAVYRYDLPGHGTSAVPTAGYDTEALSEQLAALIR